MENIGYFLIAIVGFTFLYAATNIKRCKECKIKLFDKHWWIQVVLITIGVFIIAIGIKWIK